MKSVILTDGKAGHENQSRAFARALGCETTIVPVKFRGRMAKTLSYALDRLGIGTLALFERGGIHQIARGDCDVVIGTGSGTFYAAKSLARALGAKCAVVLYPRGYSLRGFDCVFAPVFDRPRPAPNVIEIPANLVAADAEFYDKGTEAFLKIHPRGDNPRRAVAVIVGGPNKCSTMDADWMRRELERVFAENPGCEFWVTTSRRTPSEVEAVVDGFPFDYKLLYSRDHFNPIPAFVSLADVLYVTAESTGMLSEACSFGKAQVKVLDNLKPGPHKFRRFAESCAALGSRKIDLSPQFQRALQILA